MEKFSMTGANVLKRGHNIEMNEALKESLLLKSTHKPGKQGPRMCLELMMENSFRKLLSGKKCGGKKKKKNLWKQMQRWTSSIIVLHSFFQLWMNWKTNHNPKPKPPPEKNPSKQYQSVINTSPRFILKSTCCQTLGESEFS